MKVDLRLFLAKSPASKVLLALASPIIIGIFSFNILAQKQVTLSNDGRQRSVLTRAGTIGQLLTEQKVRYSPHDAVYPDAGSELRPGAKVRVAHAVPVVLEINGKRRTLMPTARRVKGLLESIGLSSYADIRLDPPASEPLVAGMIVRLQLLNRRIERIQSQIAYETRREDDPSLPRGQSRLAVKGKPGVSEKVIEHVWAGNREIEQIVRGDRIVAGPVTEVVKVGTKVPRSVVAAAPAPSISVDVSRGGRSLAMVATAYATGDGGGAGWRTATGTGVYRGIVAVDPRVIPLGTRLYVDGYGPAVAADTGGAIKGNRIDLAFNSVSEANQFGRRTVVVHILD